MAHNSTLFSKIVLHAIDVTVPASTFTEAINMAKKVGNDVEVLLDGITVVARPTSEVLDLVELWKARGGSPNG